MLLLLSLKQLPMSIFLFLKRRSALTRHVLPSRPPRESSRTRRIIIPFPAWWLSHLPETLLPHRPMEIATVMEITSQSCYRSQTTSQVADRPDRSFLHKLPVPVKATTWDSLVAYHQRSLLLQVL